MHEISEYKLKLETKKKKKKKWTKNTKANDNVKLDGIETKPNKIISERRKSKKQQLNAELINAEDR